MLVPFSFMKRSINPDAQAFITATGITNPTEISAINTLVNDLQGYGLWSKMKAIYPFVGGTSTTCKYNLKDPRDLDAAFRLVFNGGWTFASTGATPNGTNGYADTKLNASTNLTFNSIHLSFYSRDNTNTGDKVEIGCIANTTSYLPLITLSAKRTESTISNRYVSLAYSFTSGDALNSENLNSTGYYLSSRTASNSFKHFKNSIQQGSTITSNTQSTAPNRNFFIAASNGAGSATSFSDRQCAFASIGDGLTDTEASNFYTAVQAFQTTLGRQVI